MATKNLPLEELKNTTISDLFAFSGSKLVDQNEWVNQQKDEICRFPSDTFHKQGHLVQTMVEVFSKTDKKDKTKALCTLAGSLWFAHDSVYEDIIDKRSNFATLNAKLAEVEEELVSVFAEKCELDERMAQIQRERISDAHAPHGAASETEEERNADRLQLLKELERAREEIDISHAQVDNLRKLNKRQVDSLYELQAQARENSKRGDDYQKEIRELETALRKRIPQIPSGCDGSCKDTIGQLEDHIWEKEEEITSLKNLVNVEADRYWDAHNAVYAREVSIGKREDQIALLKQENDKLTRQVRENQDRVTKLQARLLKVGNHRSTGRLPLTPRTSRTREGSGSAERSDSSGTRPERKTLRKSRKDGQGGKQRKRAFFQPYPSSEEESDQEWPEKPRQKNKNKKNGRRNQDQSEEEALPHPSVKSIKDLRGMLPSFSKTEKTGSILEHILLYQRLMDTLEMNSDLELRTYLAWTFAPDSQSFFLSVDSSDYETWDEFRCEVIKHFSPHRNDHEALRHALNLKCDFNQHPRDYLQMLKNAFAQVQKVVKTETKQFKDAYFYGLPKHIRTQLARDYNENRSIDWIYKQAKSIYDVSRTEEHVEAKEKPKTSKVCEVSKEKELPFEAGGNKPRPAPKEKERKKSPERKAASAPAKEPELQNGVSPRYKGNRPIQNYVHRNRENPGDERAGAERDRPRENERGGREPYRSRENDRTESEPYRPREREGSAPNTSWQGGYGRPEFQSYRNQDYNYREREEEQPRSAHRERCLQWDERPRSPRPPQYLNALEERLKDLTHQCQRMINKDSGPSPRSHTAGSNEPTDREAQQPGQ